MRRFHLGRVGLAATALLVPAIALAAPPKYTKQETAIQSGPATALSKPVQKKLDDKKKPTLDASDVFRGVGDQLKGVTDSQIKVMQRLIDNTNDDDPEMPDYRYRRAELYAEQEHYYNFKARELDEKVFDLQQQGKAAQATQLIAQQKDYEKREKDWLKAAVKEYLAVTNNPKFNSYKKMDQVLYYLAFLLTQQKREDLARPIFRRLIKDYPQSQFIPDAYLSFGEYFFEDKQMEHALQFYEKVLQFPQSRVYGYAHYKEGWVYLNLQDYKKALETFVAVITEQNKSKDASRLSLVKEAKKDAVRSYSYIGTCDKAWTFFQRVGETYAPTMLEQLGELYNAQGKFDESICVYRQLIKLRPDDVKLCNWQREVLSNTLSKNGSRATADSVKELQRLSAVWEKYQGMKDVKPAQVEECRDNTAGSLRELATTWHKEAQKTGVKETYDLAQYLYKEYIHRFPKEKDIYPMTFYYGELLYKLEKFCDAAPIYTQVVTLDPSDKARYRNESAYAAVISWKNCLNVDDSKEQEQQAVAQSQKKKGVKNAKEDKKTEQQKAEELAIKNKPQEIPQKWQTMLSAFDTYVKYVPNAPELVTIKYRRARVYYEYNHFAEAAPLFREIVENHPKDDLALYSANLLFDCENVLGKYDDLEGDVKKFCSYPELTKDADFGHQCAVILNGIARKKIEQWEKESKFRLAADMYIKLATEHPDDPRLAELYYNAGVDYEKAKAVGLAIKTRSDLIALKPDDPLAKKSVYLLGRAYQDIAAYSYAADQYEKFANKWPGEKAPTDAATALYTASFYRLGLGETDKAIQDTTDFIRHYTGIKEYEDKSAGVFFGLYRIYENQGDKTKLEKHFRDYIKTWGTRGGVDREIIAHVKLAELLWQQSCPVPGVNGACVDVARVRASSATKAVEQAKKKGRKGKKKKEAYVIPKQCGPETKTKVTLHERIPAKAKEAQSLFAKALALYANGAAIKKIPGKDETDRKVREDQMMYSVAQARMMQGDQEYEKLLTMKVPEKLDFTPVDTYSSKAKQAKDKKRLDDSIKRFTGWLEGKTKQIELSQKMFQSVILFKQAHWAIAAAARIGQVFQDFSGQLYTAPIPKAPKPPEGINEDEFNQNFVDAYCDAMTDKAEPLEKKAIEGLSVCLNKSTELSWFNEWSQLCEGELNQIKPSEYPLASEIRAQPGYSDRRPDAAPMITEMK